MAFVLASARERGSREMDFMKRVGGVDLVVNFAQQVAADDEKFDALIREGAFEVFTHALLADEDEVGHHDRHGPEERLQTLGQGRSPKITGVHRDVRAARRV